MPIRPQCAKLALSYYKETAFGTQVLDANINKLFEPNEPVILDLTQTRIDDSAVIKGHEWPQDTSLDIVTAQDISIPFSFPCSLTLAGLMYALSMGGYTAGGAPSNYTHTCKALQACTTDTLPSTSWVLGLTGDTASYMLVKGVVINELKITLDSAGRLNLTGTALSDGTLTAKPSFSFPTSSAHAEWVTGGMGDFKIGGVSKKAKLRGLDFTINNNLDVADGRADVVNSGRYLSSLRFGSRAYNLVVRVEGHQGDEFWNAMLGETVQEVDLELTIDTNSKITYNFPVVKVASAKQSFDGIRDLLEITYKVFYDTTDATPVTVVVYNHTAAYLL